MIASAVLFVAWLVLVSGLLFFGLPTGDSEAARDVDKPGSTPGAGHFFDEAE